MAGIDLNKTKRQIDTITLVSYNALIKWLQKKNGSQTYLLTKARIDWLVATEGAIHFQTKWELLKQPATSTSCFITY